MQKLYSKDEDCYELYKTLRKKMGNKIEYSGTPYTELFYGKYFSYYREPHSDLDYLYERGLPFHYKFCKNGFLRIGVGSSIYHNTSVGEKLAALSDFYEVLSEEFGEPNVFYTIKNDDEGLLSMQWAFINKEEEIQKFKDGTYFDDAEIDELIIIGESKQKTDSYQLSYRTKKIISEHIGLPFELLSLVDENIEDYVKFKTGKELNIPEGTKIEGVPVTSFEKNMSLKRTKKSYN